MIEKNEFSKVDSYSAILVLLIFGLILYYMKVIYIPINRMSYYILSLSFSTIIMFIVLIRRQSFATVGLTKNLVAVFIIVLLSIMIMMFAIYNKKSDLIYKWLYYLIIVSFLEELMFRGFVPVRINTIIKNDKITLILVGCIFGLFHGFNDLNNQLNQIEYLISQLGAGIVGHAFFTYIYIKSNNLLVPVIIHAMINFISYIV